MAEDRSGVDGGYERPLPRLAWGLWTAGLVFLMVAIFASGSLVYKHFTGVALPGCHAGSACDKLDQSVFGRIMFPKGLTAALGFDKWPVSSLGCAFFIGIAAAWAAGMRRIAPGLKWMVRLGAGVSLMYVGVIVWMGELCLYCLVSHGANFSVLLCMEVGLMMWNRSGMMVKAPRSVTAGSRRAGVASLAAFMLAFAGATGALGMKEHGLAMAAERERASSTEKMLEKTRADAARAAAMAASPGIDDAYDFGPNGFTGRWRIGPEKAVVRIVMFGAFTCRFCKRMEQEALDLQAQNPTRVSLSFKHFPMCWMCNSTMKESDTEPVHKNACWASRCAEASAIVAGANAELEGKDRWAASNEAYWKAHKWLYNIDGVFDDASLMAGLKNLGMDAEKVKSIMDKPAADKPVTSDVAEGRALGLFQTPMIFINGIELKGWQNPGALQATVASLLSANPPVPAMDSKNDKPDLGRDKAIKDWEAESDMVFMVDTTPRKLGDADAPVKVIIFGDYQEINTAKADAIVRSWIFGPGGTAKDAASAKRVEYIFKHYPGDKTCNTKLPRTFFEHGCLTSKTAEAAALIAGSSGGPAAGNAAFWKMHDWLMTHQEGMGYDAVKRGAKAIGLDPDEVASSLNKPEIARAIQNDIDAAEAIAIKQIPSIYIQGKFVKTWMREGDDVLGRIVDKVAAESAKPK